jgi:hypothetical protein
MARAIMTEQDRQPAAARCPAQAWRGLLAQEVARPAPALERLFSTVQRMPHSVDLVDGLKLLGNLPLGWRVPAILN